MRQNRRFPILSCIVVMALVMGVGYQCSKSADTPQTALSKVSASIAGLGNSFRLLSQSLAEGNAVFTDSFVDQPTPEPTQVAGDPAPLLVNLKNPVPDDFTPTDLVRMREYCDSKVVYIKGSEIDGNRTAVDALMTMLRAAIEQGVSNWQINAGYRSVKYQQQLWDNKAYEYRQQGLSASKAQEATAKYVAKPGSSEHHTGLAFDVTVPGESFPTTKQSKWLAENCWEYGFIIRYTEEKQPITGINAEPWHIRYVGQPHARIMHENNWCLEEYIETLNNQ